MATYQELRAASELAGLLVQVQVACIVAADTISLEAAATPLHAERLEWARRVYADPAATAKTMIWAVLAKNRGLTAAQIAAVAVSNTANDAAVQGAVDAAVNVFAIVAPPVVTP
jgi:hypothetical protein